MKQVVNELQVDPGAQDLSDLAGVTNQVDLVPGGTVIPSIRSAGLPVSPLT